MNLLKCKKAQARDHFAIIVFLFIFSFMSFLGFALYLEFVSAFQASGFYVGQVESTGNAILESFKMYDMIIVVVMVLLIVALALSNFKLRTSPAFLIITIIEAVFTGYVSFFFNYIFIQMVSDPIFNAVIVFFPRTLVIMTNLHWVALVAIIVGSIALYGKKSGDEGLVNDQM